MIFYEVVIRYELPGMQAETVLLHYIFYVLACIACQCV